MRFFWQKTWIPAVETALSRRQFVTGLAAVLAAPVVVKSGVLMPVRKLIVSEAPKILVPSGVMWLQASHDGVNWTTLSRLRGPTGSRPLLPGRYAGWETRVVFDKDWVEHGGAA